jgi:hypothetical protein
MRRVASKLWNLFRHQRPETIGRNRRLPPRLRLEVEALESRITPATAGFSSTGPAVLSGVVYFDTNGNGVKDAGEIGASGVQITLTGTTTGSTKVNVSTTTDINGNFTFLDVQPGTYTLTRGNTSIFVDGQATFGNLGGTNGKDKISEIFVAEGQAGVNYDFGIRGLVAGEVSLREFLSDFTAADILPPGPGVARANNTPNPPLPTTPGTASLSGTIDNDGTKKPMAGVEVALTGVLKSNGRDIFRITHTDAMGNYTFTGLDPGTYFVNAIQPTGFRADLPTIGSLGGDIFRNDQVGDITVAKGDKGTGYNFSELALTPPASGTFVIAAQLANDTAGPAGNGTTSDGITNDPSIVGRIVTSSTIVTFKAGFDATPTSSFVSILGNINPNHRFFLNPAVLDRIDGGTLADGTHTLHLTATNANGQTTTFDVTFTLDTTPPAIPTLFIDPSIDPTDSGKAPHGTVALDGVTSAETPGVSAQLIQGPTILQTVTASSATGDFSFPGVTLAVGSNTFTVNAIDEAGNIATFTRTFTGT